MEIEDVDLTNRCLKNELSGDCAESLSGDSAKTEDEDLTKPLLEE